MKKLILVFVFIGAIIAFFAFDLDRFLTLENIKSHRLQFKQWLDRSPGLLLSFALLGVFSLVASKLTGWLKKRKVYANWPKPAKLASNLVVIGGGAAGLVSSSIAATVKAKVTLVEAHQMGGDCLN